jgi:hypothetical protein
MSQAEYRRVPAVERELAYGRRLVQPLTAPNPSQLSGSAPLIWDLLREHHTVDALVAMLQQQFSDSPAVIADGVHRALTSMTQTGLVVEA